MQHERKYPLTILIGGCTGVIAGLAVIAILFLSGSGSSKSETTISHWNSRSLLPWESIGGCGVSAGGGGGGSYQWIGRGLRGTMLDYEVHLSQSFNTDINWGLAASSSTSIPFTLNFTPANFIFTKMSLAMPFQWKRSGASGVYLQTGGIGDMSLTFNRTFGMSGRIGSSLGFKLPIGKYDVFYDMEYISTMQLGDGLFGFSASLDYSIDKEWGIMIFGGSYSGGLFAMKIVDWDWSEKKRHFISAKRKFSWARVKGGSYTFEFENNESGGIEWREAKVISGAENAYGTMSPDNFSLFFYAGKKSSEIMSSVGLSASIPIGNGRAKMFGVDYPDPFTCTLEECPDEDAAITHYIESKPQDTTHSYQNYFVAGKKINPDNPDEIIYGIRKGPYIEEKKWIILTPGVGIEFSTKFAPIFVSFSLPIEFNGDEGIGFNGFTIDLGLKGMFF